MSHSHPQSPRSVWRKLQLANTPSTRAPARGFTLTEMLVVVGIIASLLAILVPTLQGAIRSARNAAIKAEIDMLHMAIMNYKAEYGSIPPCFDAAPNQGSPAGQHIKRLFPRSDVLTEFTTLQSRGLLQAVTPNNSLTTWLSGYTTDPRLPLTGGPRQPLYDFDKSRINAIGSYHPRGTPDSPYIYINAGQYFLSRTATSYVLRDGVQIERTEDRNGNGALDPGEDLNGNSRIDVELFNPETFQIISAGRDGVFDTEDDISNFWPATRKEYSESVNQ